MSLFLNKTNGQFHDSQKLTAKEKKCLLSKPFKYYQKERSGSEKRGQVRKVSFTGVATLDLIQPYNLGYLSIQGTLNYFAIRFRSVL